MIKKVTALVLGLAVLLAAGCSENQKTDDPTPSPTPANQVEKYCLLTQETRPNQGHLSEYTYNSSGQLVSIDYSSPNNPKHHAYEMSYNADGNIVEGKFFQPSDNLNDQKWVFTYNADKLPETKKYAMLTNNVWEERAIYSFKYNTAKQLIKQSTQLLPDTAITSYSVYAYPAPDQVVVKTYFKDASGNFVLTYREQVYFDDKNFYASALGYLHYPDNMGVLLKRNVLSRSSLDYRSNATTTHTYTYNYNAEGYPVQIIDPATGSAYLTFDYDCQ